MSGNPPNPPVSDPGGGDDLNSTQSARKRDGIEQQTSVLSGVPATSMGTPAPMSSSEAVQITGIISQSYVGPVFSTDPLQNRMEVTQQMNYNNKRVSESHLAPSIPFAVESSNQYATSHLEDDLLALRAQRLNAYRQQVYIPPMAKPSLQPQDDDLFPLMDKVQEYLASDRQVMLILGDSGAGKSTFNRHLEHLLWTDYSKGYPIPLHISLPAIREPEENVIEKQLRIYDFSNEQILEMKQHRQFIVICDGYDESQLTINLHKTNQLNQQNGWQTKMIITCRTQFLGPVYMERFVPQPTDHYHTARVDLFQEAVIAPFSKEQVRAYVTCYVPLEPRPWVTDDYMLMLTTIPNLVDLVKNPFLLTLTLEALPGLTRGQKKLSSIKVTRVQLYDHFVDQWLGTNLRRLQNNVLAKEDREMLAELVEVGFVSLGIDYSTRLAQAIFDKHDSNPVIRYVHFSDKKSWMAEFFGPQPEIRLLRDASPLARSGTLYQFLHRSMLEYFFSRAVFHPRTGTDRDEFAPQQNPASPITPSFDHNGPLFKKNLLTEPSVILFLCERVRHSFDFKQELLAVVTMSRTNPEASLAAANAITILVKAGVRFNGADLRGVRIPGADLSNGQFDTAQFQAADLRGVSFARSWLREATLDGAQLEGTQFGIVPPQFDANSRWLSQYNWIEDPSSFNSTPLRQSWKAMVLIDWKKDEVVSCVFFPDGKLLAMNYETTIRVYETTSWTIVHHLCAYQGYKAGGALAFSPNSQELLSGGDDCSLNLWNCLSGAHKLVMGGHRGSVRSVTFSPCGKRVASASSDTTVRIWSVETGACILILSGHTMIINSVKYSPDGRRLVSASGDGTVRCWDAGTGEAGIIWTFPSKRVMHLAYSPNGQRIVTGDSKGDVQLWNATTGKPGLVLQGHTNSITNVAFSPNGQRIVSTSLDGTLRLWYALTGVSASVLVNQEHAIFSFSFSPDGQWIASRNTFDELILLDVVSSASSTELNGHTGTIHTVRYSSNGSSIFSGSQDRTVRQWDSLTGEYMPGSGLFQLKENFRLMVLSPDGHWIATSCSDSTIRLWNRQSNSAPELTLSGHSKNVIGIAYSPCGRWIASCSWDKTVRLWDICSRDIAEVSLQEHILAELPVDSDDTVHCLAFSSDGRQLATSDSNSTVCVYDLQTWTLMKTMTLDHKDEWPFVKEPRLVSTMAFSSRGQQQLALGNRNGSIHLWSTQSELSPGVELRGHESTVTCLAYSPCDQWIISGGFDKTVQLWRAPPQALPQAGQLRKRWTKVAVINGYLEPITCIAWNPSAPLEFVTGCEDNSIRVWKVSFTSTSNSISNNDGESKVSVRLLWRSDSRYLCALDMSFKDAVGLHPSYHRLLVQQGAKDNSSCDDGNTLADNIFNAWLKSYNDDIELFEV
ncbi:MAG: WD40-repeat-containing domain protein [Linnemannia gamsii]|nr:MAG: WD40-repeat-containing domain protein [Linnemannia gamsii]